VAAIGVLDELWFAEAGFTLEQQLANLGCAVNEDAGRASEIERNDISASIRERPQESEHVRLPGLVVDDAECSPRGPGGRVGIRLISSISSHDL
jgi:hypothetical protein